MKKTYNKPEISFDNFGISSNFALSTNCVNYPTNSTTDCPYLYAGKNIFVAESTDRKSVV